jgi:predicted phosphodiesterase
MLNPTQHNNNHVPYGINGSPKRVLVPSSSSAAAAKPESNLPSSRNNDDENSSFHVLADVDRVYCLSDLHTDHVENLHWLRHHAAQMLTQRDLVVVAGDISHDVPTFLRSIQILRRYAQVLFVHGNHEAWLNVEERKRYANSLDKFQELVLICQNHGVYARPVYIPSPVEPVWILPLESWYDGSLSFDEALCQGFEYWPWVDFARTEWPFPLAPLSSPQARIPMGLTEYFLERNRRHILRPWQHQWLNQYPADFIVTASHFLPNSQSLPDWLDLNADQFDVNRWLDHGAGTMSAKFAKVAGSKLLDQQIRTILDRPDDIDQGYDSRQSSSKQLIKRRRLIHIFGHSHRPKDFEYRNIRYIHNPLGKPRERQLYMVSPQVNFQCIWDKHVGEIQGETILRYWEEKAGGKEMLWKRMEHVKPGRYQKFQHKQHQNNTQR